MDRVSSTPILEGTLTWNADRWQTFMGAARRVDERAWQAEDSMTALILGDVAMRYAWAAHQYRYDLKTIPHAVSSENGVLGAARAREARRARIINGVSK